MWFHRLCLLTLVLSAFLSPVQGQRRETVSPPDFDIRETLPPGGRNAIHPAVRQMVDRRLANLESLHSLPGGAALRVVPNRFGLPQLMLRPGGVLTAPSSRDPEEIARGFLRTWQSVFPLRNDEVERLRLLVKDTSGGATFLAFNQTLDGIDVFNGQLKFTLNSAGEVVQASAGDVVPELSLGTTPRLTAEEAVRAAIAFTGATRPRTLAAVAGPDGRTAFRNPAGSRFSPITAELTILPMGADEARLAWRVFVEPDDRNSYEILIDAQDGTPLFRHQLTVYDAQARVWTESPSVGTRQLVTFPAAWLNGTVTSGNNADVFVDSNGDDQADANSALGLLSGRAYSNVQIFDLPYADGLSGQDPRNYKPAAVTNLFYFVNLAHDFYYRLGFTETAGNFQVDNFGRGGLGKDPVLAEAQQGNTSSNANFTTPPDGSSPRMRVGVYTRGTSSLTDDLDADYEGQIIFHEYGHGVSNRLVGARTSTSCLSKIQSGAMGEGWSDYFAISYYNNPVHGSYTQQNFQKGIRRFSYEGYPYTYEDLGNSSYTYEVHNDGEIWAAALWDLRKSLGAAVTDQLVVNGLKSTPCSPSMIDARDAILTADQATNAGANRAKIWQVFAKHGMGYSAAGVDGARYSGTIYNAAYDQPPDLQIAPNPRITSLPLQVFSMGDPFTYRITATNPAGGTLQYTLNQGPAGMTLNANGILQWGAVSFTGKRVKVTVTDGKGGRVVHGFLIPVLTIINGDTPITVDGAFNDTGYAFLFVPQGTPALQFTLRGGTGDADLYLYNPNGALYAISGHDGNTETLSVAAPAAGYWQILVFGYNDFSGASLTSSLVTPQLLDGKTPVRALSGATGSERFYRVRVPVGATSLTVTTSGGTGDADLFLRYGFAAACQEDALILQPCFYDQASAIGGNSESITLTAPKPGDYYIDLLGYTDYAGVTLTATVVAPPVFSLNSNLLTFTVSQGSTAAPPQNFSLVGTGSPVYNWTAQVSTLGGGNWLTVSRASGQGDATVAVTVNPAGLARGSYLGTITVMAPSLANSPQVLPVLLIVSGPPPVPSGSSPAPSGSGQ